MEKRAVVIGIDYEDSSRNLRSCVTDANEIASMLEQNGYIVLLMTKKIKPIYINILESFDWLLHSCNKEAFGNSNKYDLISSRAKLYFHFSGHGAQISTKSSDEPLRLNRAIITYDHKNLSDEHIHKLLISKLPGGVQLRGTVDCCNSRTNFGLRWNLVNFRDSFILQKTGSRYNSYCDAIIISGASDSGKSYGTTINGTNIGVLTYYFLEIMKENGYSISVDKLLSFIQKKIMQGRYRQSPGICFGKQMDINTIFSI